MVVMANLPTPFTLLLRLIGGMWYLIDIKYMLLGRSLVPDSRSRMLDGFASWCVNSIEHVSIG